MSSEVLRADSIAKAYRGRGRVLSAATLRAHGGVLTFLVGRNGCGKSTLLQIAAGALEADGGMIRFKGRALAHPRWPQLARDGLFYLPDRDLLAPSRTVREHLAHVAERFATDGFDAVVARLELSTLLDRKVAGLSTGERRRAELGVALSRRPDCLLVDEPHRNIDPTDQSLVTGGLVALARQGCAVVVTGHEVEQLLPAADQVVWCTDGTTYDLGQSREALAHERFVLEYVGRDRASRLLQPR